MGNVGKRCKSWEKLRKVVPFEHKYGTDGKCWQKLAKVDKSQEMLAKDAKSWESCQMSGTVEKS